jgi:cysteine desulfurase
MIYFDHAASTPILPQALDILCESSKADFANPASAHKLGKSLAKEIDNCRLEIKKLLNASNEYEVIFVSSATEANNLVINSFDSICSSYADHPSVVAPTKVNSAGKFLSSNKYDDVKIETVKLLVVTHVNSQSGQILDLKNILERSHQNKTKILVDASQSCGKIKIDLGQSPVDFLTIASHKLGGPRGVAALVFKKSHSNLLNAGLKGGGHEFGIRSSTPATSLIKSLTEAMSVTLANELKNFRRVSLFSQKIVTELKKVHANFSFPFIEENYSPYILCIVFSGVPSDVLLRHLEMKNVFVSSSTACSSKIKADNPILDAIGIEQKLQKNVLRISMGTSTTEEEVEALIKAFQEVINEISFLIK